MTLCWKFGQRFQDRLLDVMWNSRIHLARRRRLFALMLLEQGSASRARERDVPCEEFISKTSQGILISGSIVGTLKLFWRHIPAQGCTLTSICTKGSKYTAEMEIAQYYVVMLCEKHVLRGEIAMRDVLLVRSIHGLAYLLNDAKRLIERQGFV